MSSTKYARLVLLIATFTAFFVESVAADETNEPSRQRRVLYNFDGCSCIFTRADSKGPVEVTVDDLRTLIDEIAYEGSQVDTVLICVNAKVMYYPTQVGTMLGTQATADERAQWPASNRQWFHNLKHFFDADTDPWAVMLTEAKRQGLEALLSFRMNDAHQDAILRTKFWMDHPDYRLPNGGLDFAHVEVRDHIFRLIEEAVQRYDCDGIELDFNRFPVFFQKDFQGDRIGKMNALVERVRKMLDEEGNKRNRHLVLTVRPPSGYWTLPTYEDSVKIGCDPVVWVKNGWIDFLTVSRFLNVHYDLPIAQWKKRITTIPVYGCIECTDGETRTRLTPENYRRAARHIWNDGGNGIYLFNFFTSREHGEDSNEPAFELLKELGDRNVLLQQRTPHATNSRLSIEPLLVEPGQTNRMDGANLPVELVEDEKLLIEKNADLPVILIRSKDYPGAVWTLRLPEMGILGTEGRTGYQTKYHWKQDSPNAYSFNWHPITGSRLGRGPLPGKVRSRVFVKDDSRVDFEVHYKNESDEKWVLPMVWICLIHKYAGPGESFFWLDDSLQPTSSVPDPKDIWLKLFTVQGHEAFTAAHQKWDDYTIRPGLATKPELVWQSNDHEGFEVRIGSDQAGLLGWSKWPCTDMGLVVDEIGPGEEATYSGYVTLGFNKVRGKP